MKSPLAGSSGLRARNVSFLPFDSYGIVKSRGLSIPYESPGYRHVFTIGGMSYRQDESWKKWGERVRAHMQDKRLRTVKVAHKLKMSEPGLRSWLNGNREINLSDFFRLCDAIEADCQQILFGRPTITAEQRKQIGEFVASVLDQDPASQPGYKQFIGGLQKDLNGRRGKK